RLAAAIGADDAGHARLDQQLGMVDEGFETGKSKTRDLQLALSLLLAASGSDRSPLAGDCRFPPRGWRGGREGGFEIPGIRRGGQLISFSVPLPSASFRNPRTAAHLPASCR